MALLVKKVRRYKPPAKTIIIRIKVRIILLVSARKITPSFLDK
jgi:hypothetical protein